MKSINEDIKNNDFKQVYLLYGEEAFLKKRYKKKLRQALAAEDDTMNCSSFEGKGINPNEVIDLAETLPFFSERRVIIIEDSGFFKNQSPEMAEYMKEIAPSTYFVFVEEEVDKRSKMFKAVKTAGRIVEFPRQDAQTLTKWIIGLLKAENKKITQPTMHLFLEMVGNDMENIEKEIEKIICYIGDREVIESEDIKAVCTYQVTNQIFEMISSIAERKHKKALQLYYDLLALKEPPMRILFLIARQFNLLMQVKELKKLGYDSKTIGQKTGLYGFVVGKYISQSKHFTIEQLKEALQDCVEMEEQVKSGKIIDRICIELLIVKYSQD
ncbi:DNA polymerase III subunit delta [Anaerosacchariphilus polymeriproducens]|uniref:DNA polymerase III subunit delta n=1 Tax=Anaerosacchariphilus polymeriproducens TaxID=1812858 RepID=A0A371AWT5_9FIRM|nr:DNA polymerase III subunit delta [Anaerosacchariphilus polymeriproducens]RDU23982.1 DNA polymerase III subunit delta [Anaerosacchariphilus polymeriproducens]